MRPIVLGSRLEQFYTRGRVGLWCGLVLSSLSVAQAQPLDPPAENTEVREIEVQPQSANITVVSEKTSKNPDLQTLLAERGKGNDEVWVHSDPDGDLLIVENKPFLIKGMNWGYVPIGTNYSYNFWAEPEWVIKTVLDKEMGMLKEMGVNSIRQYNGIPPKWVTYIYDNYGITTMINHTAGRYGLDIDGSWVPVTNYQDPRTREIIKAQIRDVILEYKDTRGVLLWLLGNENNYGLHWSSFEIEKLPEGEQHAERAKHLYSLYGELVDEVHAMDPKHPVAIANGDLQYIDLIAEYIPNLDLLGTNVYRGVSARDLYQEVESKLGIPIFYSEFGADAYNAKEQREDHLSQAYFLQQQWKEIYQQSHGKGLVGNAIGGYTFQWADGWWKHLQEENLDVHDTNASWPNGGYYLDYVDGQNNMNEEWFGICAKGPPDDNNLYELYPRAAYYLLKDAYALDPYQTKPTVAEIEAHFEGLSPNSYDMTYRSSLAVSELQALRAVRLSDVRGIHSTFANDSGNGLRSIEHMQSIYVDLTTEPNANIRADVSLNILGNVPENRIDELFYEARGRNVVLTDTEGIEVVIEDRNRLQLYNSKLEWKSEHFTLNAFFREGHYHWAHEGDFFNFYQEAHYGPNPDIYNADVPIGVEIAGSGALEGFKMAAGPQIYWGANPTVLTKYERKMGKWHTAVLYQEDFTNQGNITTLNVIPEQPLRRGSLYAGRQLGPVKLELGALNSGSNKNGQSFLYPEEGGAYAGSSTEIVESEVYWLDALGGKVRLTGEHGAFKWYIQSAYQGVVSDGGGEQDVRFTGWSVRPSGRGNHWHAIGGMALNIGQMQIAPLVLYQQPLFGPMPSISSSVNESTGVFQPSMQPRSVFSDPFMVIENRETMAAELLLAYDQTPGTWMWYWDNDIKEDARFAASVSGIYRHQPTQRDATIGFNEYGVLFAFDEAPPAQDVWEVTGRIVSVTDRTRWVINANVGTAQSGGSDPRLIDFYRFQIRNWTKNFYGETHIKVNDWGPFDYHRVFNLTFPLQVIGNYSVGMRKPVFGEFYPRVGFSMKYRLTDQYSPETIPLDRYQGMYGHQYEGGAYVAFGR